ncbi:MAG: methyltransferase type 11 [Pelagibacterium sp. SCN 63-23]|nr:MAG: methyltransferase type 11 [Pelagibacterium sp. SCN 63-23]
MIARIGKSALNAVHGRLIFGRRVEALGRALAALIPAGDGEVLDLGCGDGQVALALMQLRPELTVEGVDVLVRPVTHIKVTRYDGVVLPFADKSFDHVTIVDVLHHTDEPALILAEAARVARRSVVVKDHLRQGWLAGSTLRLMDWVGNRGHDVRLPYNYLSENEWQDAFAKAGLVAGQRQVKLGLYPAWLDWLFGRQLHFVQRLEPINLR